MFRHTRYKPTRREMDLLHAIYEAWEDPGINPQYHERMKTKVRAFMPVLAQHLDKLTRQMSKRS